MCDTPRVVKSPSSYITDIRRDEYSNRVTAIDQSRNIDVWYSAVIADITEVKDDLVVTMVDGEVHRVPLYKGVSPDLLNQVLTGYVSKTEFCLYKEEIKNMLEHDYVKQTDLAVIIENLKCYCRSQCGGCGTCSTCCEK